MSLLTALDRCSKPSGDGVKMPCGVFAVHVNSYLFKDHADV